MALRVKLLPIYCTHAEGADWEWEVSLIHRRMPIWRQFDASIFCMARVASAVWMRCV